MPTHELHPDEVHRTATTMPGRRRRRDGEPAAHRSPAPPRPDRPGQSPMGPAWWSACWGRPSMLNWPRVARPSRTGSWRRGRRSWSRRPVGGPWREDWANLLERAGETPPPRSPRVSLNRPAIARCEGKIREMLALAGPAAPDLGPRRRGGEHALARRHRTALPSRWPFGLGTFPHRGDGPAGSLVVAPAVALVGTIRWRPWNSESTLPTSRCPGDLRPWRPTLAATARAAEEGGCSVFTLMDHWFQMETFASSQDPMLEGYTALGLPGRADRVDDA